MKANIEKYIKKLIKYPVTIWMLLSVLLLGTLVIVHAAYKGTDDVKRVVSTQASSREVFSSNYMDPNTELVVKNLRTANAGEFVCNVTICNYDQLDPASTAKGLITYDFTAELTRYDAATDQYLAVTQVQKDGSRDKIFYVQKKMDNNLAINSDTHNINTGTFSYTYSGETLTPSDPCKDSYDICFDRSVIEEDPPQLFIRVTATPTAESMQLNAGITTLSCIIGVSQGRTVETGWHGSLDESSGSNYDGYNLVIEGSGKGTIDILWDSREFTINPAFKEIYVSQLEEKTADTEGWSKLTLTVDSDNQNRYVVQFFKKIPGKDYPSNDFASKYIKCNNYIMSSN